MTTVVEIVDHAREFNRFIDITRLERMHLIYRSWISSPASVESGFSLTQDELECVLEYPSNSHHLVFLMETFRTNPPNEPARMDLLALLATCACLARGPLQAKATFLFSLVDFDTEDEIVEDELAMLIALCTDGLGRLGILVTEIADVDAHALACEAFEFVDIEDGGKMNLGLFVQWLVSHWRPAALFDRIQTLFLISIVAQRLHVALHQHTHDTSPFHTYNNLHFREDTEDEHASIVVGPIVGPVTFDEVRILLEVNRKTIVQIFAFLTSANARVGQRPDGRRYTVTLEAWLPQVIVCNDLLPGETYHFRLLGVCKRDRERCIAIATTPQRSLGAADRDTVWGMYTMNHEGIDQNPDAYHRMKQDRLKSAEENSAFVTVHFSAIHISVSTLMKMTELCCDDSAASNEMACRLLLQSFRNSLNHPELYELLRFGSNLLVCSRFEILFKESNVMSSHPTDGSTHDCITKLMKLALDPWRMYIGMLWDIKSDEVITRVYHDQCCILLKYDERHNKCDPSLTQILPTVTSARDLIVIAATPILPLKLDNSSSYNLDGPSASDDPGAEDLFKDVNDLVDWKRGSITCNVCVVSRHPVGGVQSRYNVKGTTITIEQVLCGPVAGGANYGNSQFQAHSSNLGDATLSTSAPQTVPHCVIIRGVVSESSSRPSSQVGSSRPASRSALRSSKGDRNFHQTRLLSQYVLLGADDGPNIIAGPIVTTVSERHAVIVLECEEDRKVNVCLTDQFTKQVHEGTVKLRRREPGKCLIEGLRPGRVYHVSVPGMRTMINGLVQTPRREPAGLRMLLLAADSFCDLSATERRRFTSSTTASFMGNILQHLVHGHDRSTPNVMYDIAVHVGSLAALRNDILHGHEMMRSDPTKPFPVTSKVEEMVRACYRSYTAVPDVRALRSLGANWFSGIGVIRSLIQNDAPIRLLRTVGKVISEYEYSEATLEQHDSGLVHKLASQVYAIKLDTTDCLVNGSTSDFIEWPEHLLTRRQLSALRHILSPSPSLSFSKQVIIFCDAPLVWPFLLDSVQNRKSKLDKIADIARDPWSAYSYDLRLLLDMLFEAIATDSLLSITLVCNGMLASRVIISHKNTGRNIEQLTLGTVSNIDGDKRTARYAPESTLSTLGDDYTIVGRTVGGSEVSLKQYCVLNIVAHQRGAVCNHAFFTSGLPDSSIILGPVIGRVTTRTARILIEVDRPAQTVTCVLTAASSGHSVTTNAEIQAFVPTIFKLEGLHPGTRYKVNFEGVMVEQDGIDVYVETPALVPLAVEWLVFSRNNLRNFLPVTDEDDHTKSHWHRILSPGARSHNAKIASIVSNRNEDSLGESRDQQSEQFNPWYHVEGFALSEPLRQTQLSVHIGGQVDLGSAFTEEELYKLVLQLCDSMLSEAFKNDLYVNVRYRLQELYRNTWGVEPMRTIMSHTSNVMLLHEATDLFFSASRIQELVGRQFSPSESSKIPTDDQLSQVAVRLRALAFEQWQLYQNQLSVDVNESDLDNSRRNSSKFGSHLTLGMCRLVFANVSGELRDLCSSPIMNLQDKVRPKTPHVVDNVAPLTLPTTTDNIQVSLLSSATWKTIDEAMDSSVAEGAAGAQQTKRSKPKQSSSAIKQLVLFLPIDLIEVVTMFPAVRAEIVRLMEKLFHWKLVAREERNVTLICSSEHSSSLSFTVTDEKVNESLVMTRIASISQLKEAQYTKSVQTKGKPSNKGNASIKGYFSKRFIYQSAPIATGSAMVTQGGTQCRGYANYLFLSDYRRGVLNESVLYFPSRALPKIVLGPVIGRMDRKELEVPETDTADDVIQRISFSVPILVEISALARLTCVVVDSMINSEVRLTREVQASQPTVFCIHGLVPHRRYVYFFEGVSNGETRRGSFHTPPLDSNCLNLVAVSSNFPTHMDEEQDSLWMPLVERAKLPWCGLDAIVHLGGQVPLHEAALECFEWANRELQREIWHGDPKDVNAQRVQHVRTRIRRRFQQEYRICWNLPNIRELLAHASHWFLHSKADIAPFFGSESPGPGEASRTTTLIVEVAKEVVLEYQMKLMETASEDAEAENVRQAPTATIGEPKPLEAISSAVEERQQVAPAVPEIMAASINDPVIIDGQTDPVEDDQDTTGGEVVDKGGALYWQHGDIAVFISDVRTVTFESITNKSKEEPITCNGRLSRPLSIQENPKMNEKQWKYLESVLRKKHILLFIVCFEVPLILTNAIHVEKLRDELRYGQMQGSGWKLYDHNHVLQHWVACKRQLEQLLLLLFKWKAKRSGRDVLILSGGMRIGIDTLIQDRESKLSIRNLTVGPVTATIETFEFPLNGVACATFGGGVKEDHFTFHHNLLAKKNYVFVRANIDQSVDDSTKPAKSNPNEGKSSNVIADFVPNEPVALARLHPIDKFRRFPMWWTAYVPTGKAVFWDDTITLKSETDERMLALRDYIWHDRGFSGALEVFYEKYQFAETARMEDLRSRHSQHIDLKANFMSVLNELWRAIPESKRQQMAYFLDPFVLEMLLGHVAPDLVTKRLQSGEPIELAYFSRLLRDFVFDACLLRLTIITQQEDEARAHRAAVEKRKRDEEPAVQEKERVELAAQQEAERMAELLRTDPLQYATIKLAQEEAEKLEKLTRHQEKLEKKKAERLAELEEEQAIAKEQKQLNKLAERDPLEYERRQHELEVRIRKLEEKRAQRAAQKKAAADKVAKATSADL